MVCTTILISINNHCNYSQNGTVGKGKWPRISLVQTVCKVAAAASTSSPVVKRHTLSRTVPLSKVLALPCARGAQWSPARTAMSASASFPARISQSIPARTKERPPGSPRRRPPIRPHRQGFSPNGGSWLARGTLPLKAPPLEGRGCRPAACNARHVVGAGLGHVRQEVRISGSWERLPVPPSKRDFGVRPHSKSPVPWGPWSPCAPAWRRRRVPHLEGHRQRAGRLGGIHNQRHTRVRQMAAMPSTGRI